MKKLLLLHGALGSKDQFSELIAKLRGKYEVHAINFSGHGGKDIPAEPFTMEMFAKDIAGYLDEKNISEIDVFGYSMGGYAALLMELQSPGRIKKIFTLATKFEWSPEIAEREVKMLDAEKIKKKVPKFAEELAKRHGEENWVKLLEKTAAMMRELGNGNPLELNQLSNEVMVAVGDRDNMVSLEETITAYRAIPNAKLLVIPGTPHPIEQANIGILAEEIKRFLI